MTNSLFKRHFFLTAGMILISFFLLAAAFMSLSYRYTLQDKKKTMTNDVAYVAAMTSGILSRGGAVTDDGFLSYLSSVSSISDTDVMICGPDGGILCLFSDSTDEIDRSVTAISPSVAQQLIQQGGYTGMSTLDVYSEAYYVSGAPVYLTEDESGTPAALVFVAASMDELVAMWKVFATLFFFTGVVVLCIAFLSSSVTSLQQTKPLKDMADVVRRFGQGEYQLRADSFGRKDEVGELARAFNAMANSIASAETRRQEFVANISHELKTPLTTISGFTEGILDGTIPPEKTQQSLQVVASETRRLSRLVHRMLDVSQLQARGENQSHVEFDLTDTMAQVIISLEGKLSGRNLDMDVHFPDGPLMVWGDPDGITQVCYNLLDNAAKFAAPGSVIGVSITAKGGKAHVTIRNQGDTIPAEELPMLFDRFHKSDRSRSMDKEGVGLGLYIVKTILDQHKESITVTSNDGVTEFSFTLTLAG